MISKCSKFVIRLFVLVITLTASNFVFPEDVIKIGVLSSPTSNMISGNDESVKETILMLAKNQNINGGLLDRKIEVVTLPVSQWSSLNEKTTELIKKENVDVIFGAWPSVFHKSIAPIFESLDTILIYTADYEGQEPSKNIFYTGSSPNKEAIPAVDYLIDRGIQRWVLEGTDYAFSINTSKIIKSYLTSQGINESDISINFSPFGYDDWGDRVSSLKSFSSENKKTAVISTINGSSNLNFYEELVSQKISPENLPVLSLSLSEQELKSLENEWVEGHLITGSYFNHIELGGNQDFLNYWGGSPGENMSINPSTESVYLGFKAWVNAVQRAGVTDLKQVRSEMYHVSISNLFGEKSVVLANNQLTKPIFINEIKNNGKFELVYKSDEDLDNPWSDHLSKSKNIVANWEENLAWQFEVWYGTNRKKGRDFERIGFSNEYIQGFHYGKATVNIPYRRSTGSIGSNALVRLVTGNDDRLKVKSYGYLTEDKFFETMQDAFGKIQEKNEKVILLYIHGYNNSFDEALLRTAQLGVDLKITGVTAMFSWPSKDSVWSYKKDDDSIELSVGALQSYLEKLSDKSGAETVHIIAHSMGNKGLSEVIERFRLLNKNSELKIGQIILAAPDINVRRFEQIAEYYPQISDRTTVYISPTDFPLGLSKFINEYRRLGEDTNPKNTSLIDFIHVPRAKLLDLGHAYFAENRHVISDMIQLIHNNVEPSKRASVQQVEQEGYWKIY